MHGNSPDVLANSLTFVCEVRKGFAALLLTPLSSLWVVSIKTGTGTSYMVRSSQQEGACESDTPRRLAGGEEHQILSHRRRHLQLLPTLTVELSIEVAKSALPALASITSSSSSSAASASLADAVRLTIEAALTQNASLVSSVLSQISGSACAAQNIGAPACPGPSSIGFSSTSTDGLASSSSSSLSSSNDGGRWVTAVYGLSSALAATLLFVVIFISWRWITKSWKPAAVAPLPTPHAPDPYPHYPDGEFRPRKLPINNWTSGT